MNDNNIKIDNNFKLKHISFNKILNSNVIFGFLMYLMSDCILFSVFFSVYFVISYNYNFDIFKNNLINIYYVFLETSFLLFSSCTYSISMVFLKYKKIFYFYVFIMLTFLLGFAFVLIEVNELFNLSKNVFFISKNGFFSSFVSLLTLHACHILFGLLWIIFMLIKFNLSAFNYNMYIQFFCLGLFWHFLDIIWMLIFNFIYLFGFIK
ncbi:cytochrome c oxidase subunit 3 [Buchnera aphidicola (Ceratovacuna keduensis)]|uniref:cytochrome c oxidase subunit 3 n=1 Tax=Buchnera aphidicola TaxID=9 RepID=UPI0031B80E76